MYADDSSGVGNDSYVKLAEAEADVAAGVVKFGWRDCACVAVVFQMPNLS